MNFRFGMLTTSITSC